MKKIDEKELDKELAEKSDELKEKEKEVISSIREGNERWKKYLDMTTDVCEKWLNTRDIWATALMLIAENIGTEFDVEDKHKGRFNVNVHAYPNGDTGKWKLKLEVIRIESEEEKKDD